MKKAFFLLALVAATITAQAQVEFAYDAGAEVVSAYLWRGQYNGGLSFQPDLAVGFDHDHVQFRFGTWWSIGASDWGFRKGLEKEEDYNPNTYFIPEVDVYASLRSHGVTVGFTHYYYFGGSKFFNFGKIDAIDGTSQTEVMIGIDGDDWLPEAHHVYANWNTFVSGADANYNMKETGEVEVKRAYSSYLELGYDYTFENIGLTLGAQVGIVPWASNDVYGTEKAAVKCVGLKLNKAWDLDVCEINLFAQGMVDTYQIDKENVFIKASGDDKLYNQKLNGCIGVGFWF